MVVELTHLSVALAQASDTSMPTLSLTASDRNWRLFMLRKADQAFRSFSDKIKISQNYCCQFCGFQSKQFQEIVNLDGDYHNNKRSNLVTACALCSQCCFLESVGQGEFGGGSLIVLPELSQNQLNALCHALFIQMAASTQLSTQAKNVYRSLKLRSQLVEKQLGEGMSNPSVYGRMLVDNSGPQATQVHSKVCEKVRLLPNIEKFSLQIQAWVREAIESSLQ